MRTGIRLLRLATLAAFCTPFVLSTTVIPAFAKAAKGKATAVHEQGDETELNWKKVKTCVFKIDSSEWKDQISMPNIPEQYQTDQTRLRPKNALLVINASVVNRGNEAVRTGGFDVRPPVFRLTNEQGQVFAPSEHPAVQQAGLTMKFWMGADVNPGSALTGTIVFDVPKGDYILVTYNSKREGNSYQPDNELFRHKLTPTEAQQSTQTQK